jgi:hypothetical protein
MIKTIHRAIQDWEKRRMRDVEISPKDAILRTSL